MAAGIYRKRMRNLDLTGLLSSVYEAAAAIDSGRKGFATRGEEQEGRINYEDGIAQAIILAEYTFITRELEFCEKTDKVAISSLSRAIRFFDDAFLVLKIVKDKTKYQIVENSYPHDNEYRAKGYPMDSFHIACKGHKGRLQNIFNVSSTK